MTSASCSSLRGSRGAPLRRRRARVRLRHARPVPPRLPRLGRAGPGRHQAGRAGHARAPGRAAARRARVRQRRWGAHRAHAQRTHAGAQRLPFRRSGFSSLPAPRRVPRYRSRARQPSGLVSYQSGAVLHHPRPSRAQPDGSDRRPRARQRIRPTRSLSVESAVTPRLEVVVVLLITQRRRSVTTPVDDRVQLDTMIVLLGFAACTP
jgi:hypothetical protein